MYDYYYENEYNYSEIDAYAYCKDTLASLPLDDFNDNVIANPRSLAEALCKASDHKFRQLPCRTFISVGACPYRDRCVYLHDPRILTRDAKAKSRKKNKEDIIQDSLFWPVMPEASIRFKLDGKNQPLVNQEYQVPTPQDDQYYRHDAAVYSLWQHFIAFCIRINAETDPHSIPNLAYKVASGTVLPNSFNTITGERRLPVFEILSYGMSVNTNTNTINHTNDDHTNDNHSNTNTMDCITSDDVTDTMSGFKAFLSPISSSSSSLSSPSLLLPSSSSPTSVATRLSPLAPSFSPSPPSPPGLPQPSSVPSSSVPSSSKEPSKSSLSSLSFIHLIEYTNTITTINNDDDILSLEECHYPSIEDIEVSDILGPLIAKKNVSNNIWKNNNTFWSTNSGCDFIQSSFSKNDKSLF